MEKYEIKAIHGRVIKYYNALKKSTLRWSDGARIGCIFSLWLDAFAIIDGAVPFNKPSLNKHAAANALDVNFGLPFEIRPESALEHHASIIPIFSS